MRKESTQQRYEIFLISAAIAAHAIHSEDGFRQRDLKFLMEMFSNWLDFCFPSRTIEIENVQIKRYLEWLVREHFATVRKPTKAPHYRLTQAGIINLLQRLAKQEPQFPFEFFLFRYHILRTYKEPIFLLIEQEGHRFPSTIKAEVEHLFDFKHLIQEMKRFVDFELKRLELRVKENEEVLQLITKSKRDGLQQEQIISNIENRYPYELNSQKPLSEFYGEMPANFREFILEIAIDRRRKDLWIPTLETIKSYQNVLTKMLSELGG